MNQYYRFFFPPAFTLCLCIINQAKWKQIPVMLIISCVGYVVNFFSAKKFPSSAPIANTLGALAVGVIGNLYSRMRHGVAAAAILPAIFVQVPSGLAATGSLLQGLYTADQITSGATYANGTAKVNGTSSVSLLIDHIFVVKQLVGLPASVKYLYSLELPFVLRLHSTLMILKLIHLHCIFFRTFTDTSCPYRLHLAALKTRIQLSSTSGSA
jgi:uncharacterized membrane protein YjjB (DUF3815 family)